MRVAGVTDGVVRLQWEPPSGGPAPVGYLLEGGYEPGQVLGQVVFGAALDAKRDVQVIERLTQSPDHPVLLTFPEGEYLKGLICRVW